MTPEEIEQDQRDRKAKVTARAQADRDARDREREEHQRAMDEQAAQAAQELEELMKGLKEPEQRLVRLHAALHCKAHNFSTPHNKQAAYDDVAKELARYMITGKVA